MRMHRMVKHVMISLHVTVLLGLYVVYQNFKSTQPSGNLETRYIVTQRQTLPPCNERRHHIAYIKVHKSGSTSLASILDSFGLKNNLSFVESFWDIYHIDFPYDILEDKVLPPLTDHYDLLTSHARYDPMVLQRLMPEDTIYMCSLREPLSHFLSSFYYVYANEDVGRMFNVTDEAKILEIFLSDPGRIRKLYLQNVRPGFRDTVHHTMIMPNSQLDFLGLSRPESLSKEVLETYIEQIISQFDIIVLTEYFEASMVLLKRVLCWDLEDVLFLKQNKGGKPLRVSDLSQEVSLKILDYNSADVLLYTKANASFWERIKHEDKFEEEVVQYRTMLSEFQAYCSGKIQTRQFSRKSCTDGLQHFQRRKKIQERQRKVGMTRLMAEVLKKD